jgi:hypothetical protein
LSTYLADHEDLVGLGELGKLLERRHEALVVVTPACSVDENDIVPLGSAVRDGILGYRRGVLAVALLVDVDGAALARRELLEVAHVHGELLDGAGAEGVGGGDEDLVPVLQEEEADLGEVGGLADTIDADDGEDVGARLAEGGHGRGCHGVDFAEEVEGGGRGEHLGEGGFHGGLDAGVDAWVWMLAWCGNLWRAREDRTGTHSRSCRS